MRALNRDAEAMHQAVRYPLPEDRRIGWSRFPLEILLWALPWLVAGALWMARWHAEWLAFLARPETVESVQPFLLILLGVAWMLRISFRYHGRFEDASIGSLLEDVTVSQMRPRGVRLKGEILGRGEPGAFWSADPVLRDPTGILFVLYRQDIPLARSLFALTEAENYIGQQVEIEGWFRRGLTPYVEMSRLAGKDGATHLEARKAPRRYSPALKGRGLNSQDRAFTRSHRSLLVRASTAAGADRTTGGRIDIAEGGPVGATYLLADRPLAGAAGGRGGGGWREGGPSGRDGENGQQDKDEGFAHQSVPPGEGLKSPTS